MYKIKLNKWAYLGLAGLLLLIVAASLFFIKINKETTRFKELPLEVKLQPEGELRGIPEEITFYFSKSFSGVEGVEISSDSIGNFIKIDPPLPASGKWLSERRFELSFRKKPLPETEYHIKMVKIPLLTDAEKIPTRKFQFSTPKFTLNSIVLKMTGKEQAVILLDFNYTPVIDGIQKYLEVTDSKMQPVKIISLKPKTSQELLLTVPVKDAPQQYTVTVKKGLKSKEGVSLRERYTQIIPIGFSTRPLNVRSGRVEESDDGYMIAFQMSSTSGQTVSIYEENLNDLIRVEPEIKFQASASNNGIYIVADFIPEKAYKVTLKAGVSTATGDILQQDHSQEFTMPQKKEKLQFLYRGRYFGKNGAWNLPLKVSQFSAISVSITYMPPENVLFWHLKDYGNSRYISNLGEPVISDHTIPVEKGSKDQIVNIDLREMIKEFNKGIYLVEATGRNKNKYSSDRVAVVISDISLIVKWYDKCIYLWALNSSDLKPEGGVDIEVRSSKNFLTGKGTTDNGGYCVIPILKEGRDPYMVFAKKGNEWTYAHIQSLRLPMEAYDIAGEAPDVPYLAYVYPERDLYRPGEEVRFNVMLREKHTFEGAMVPVRVNIRDPQGRNYLSLSGTTSNYGLKEFTFPTTPSSPTGKYMIELITGDRVIYSGSVFVEAFVPERMRITPGFTGKLDLYKNFDLNVEAEFLFGAPASGEEYTIKVRAEEIPFLSAGYFNYFFGPVLFGKEKAPSWESENIDGNLDNNGKGSETFRIDRDLQFNRPVRLKGLVTVTEGGSGRVTSRMVEKNVYTRPYYIGLKPSTTRIASGVPLEIKGVLLSPDQSLYDKKAKIYYRVYRLSYYYSYGYNDDYYYDDYYWNARVNKLPVTMKKYLEPAEGKFSFSFTPTANYNDYLVEVVDETNGTISQVKICGWGWWYGQEEKVESPEVVPIRLDKKEYDYGEEVKVEALLPFEGNILWTVELDTIYTTEWTQARGEVASWKFRTPKGRSTAYVSALLVRSGGNYLVQRGFGVQRVRIRPGQHNLELSLTTPEMIRPGEELIVRVKSNNRFKGTIAVVDEGILQITDFQTPDPYQGLLRDLKLYMNSAESFGWIIKKFMDKTGGGFGTKEKEFPEARFAKIVSFWSGILESGNDGNLTYKLKIPEYNGKLRVMVAGATDKKVGSCQSNVIVKSDVIISPTIPRFMYTGDEFSFPVTLINTTRERKDVRLSIGLKGCSLKGDDKLSIGLKPQEKLTQWLECVAGDNPGALDIKIEASSGSVKYQEDFTIPLYPNVPFITESEYYPIKSGEKTDLKKYFDNWYPRAHKANLVVSSIPALSRLNHLKYVIHYPYGCIEQTSTSTLVLLRLSSLLPVLVPDLTKEKYTEMVNHGIGRIISMQTISGGFAYWPGNGEPCEWGSGYATLVLLEAKKAGFVVPENAISAALNYLDAMSNKSGMIYYVLARGGSLQKKPELVDRIITLAKKEEYNALNLLWAAGAVFESGKTEQAKAILRLALNKTPESGRRYVNDFYSPMQYNGIKLYMIENIEPGTEQESKMVIQVAEDLSKKWSYYYSTQDLAWNLLSLGIYAGKQVSGGQLADLKIEGRIEKPKADNGIFSWSLVNPGNYSQISMEAKSNSAIFLNIENTGFSKQKRSFDAFSNGITLSREIYNYSGDLAVKARQGDILVIKVGLKTTSGYYDNVAVEAALPGGLEIENPRLGRGDLPGWLNSQGDRLWMPDYVDMRDDRVIIFGRASYETKYYYFLARAVTPGKFFMPPANAVVMYNPELNSHTNAGNFEISRR